jgi:hypothetical protein
VLVAPQQLTYYQVNSTDVFMDAIDATYCQVSGGNNCGDFAATSVISVSWGADEYAGDAQQTRLCNEYVDSLLFLPLLTSALADT